MHHTVKRRIARNCRKNLEPSTPTFGITHACATTLWHYPINASIAQCMSNNSLFGQANKDHGEKHKEACAAAQLYGRFTEVTQPDFFVFVILSTVRRPSITKHENSELHGHTNPPFLCSGRAATLHSMVV